MKIHTTSIYYTVTAEGQSPEKKNFQPGTASPESRKTIICRERIQF